MKKDIKINVTENMDGACEILTNKIDFVSIIEVNDANPNGDPGNGGRPRTTSDGRGEISPECIKRKLRNRFVDWDMPVFVQSEDKAVDEYKSLSERFRGMIPDNKALSQDQIYIRSCELWSDVRAFGATFAYKETSAKKDSVSVGVKGSVSIMPAHSVAPVNIVSTQITKSVNGDAALKMSSDRMGTTHRVEHGVYVIKGSISAVQAEKNGFTVKDAEDIRKALQSLFVNDESASRPAGSMRVVKVYWFTHNGNSGSTYETHKAVKVALKDGVLVPTSIDDYVISCGAVEGVTCEEFDGE